MQKNIYSKRITEATGQAVHEIDDGAADGGYGEEAQAAPGGDDADDQGNDAGEGREGGLDHAGEGHHGQRDVGHVVKEAAQETVADLVFDQQHRHHTDEVRGDDGQQDGKFIIH